MWKLCVLLLVSLASAHDHHGDGSLPKLSLLDVEEAAPKSEAEFTDEDRFLQAAEANDLPTLISLSQKGIGSKNLKVCYFILAHKNPLFLSSLFSLWSFLILE
jgi:hypothetical protein